MKSESSILVVGGGIFGITAALECAKRGYSVSVFDPGPLPHPRAATTDISKVIRMDYGADEIYMDLMQAAFPIWDRWNAEWERPLYHQTGIIFITSRPLHPGEFEYESYIRLEQRGLQPERLDSRSIRERFPAWNSTQYVDGYFNPRAGWAESGAVLAHLIRDARSAGVHLYEGEAFAGLLETNRRVDGIVTEQGQRYNGDLVVLAAGSWTRGLAPFLNRLMWPNGQSVFHFSPQTVQDYLPPQFPVWGADIHRLGWYGFPANPDGVVKIANHGPGWLVDPRDQSTVPAEAEDLYRQFLRQSIPGLANTPVAKTRLCFYCDTFDGNFLIDYVPEYENLLICSGGSGHGFKFAPVLGSITADVVERKPNRFAHRFAWRQPVENQGAVTPERK